MEWNTGLCHPVWRLWHYLNWWTWDMEGQRELDKDPNQEEEGKNFKWDDEDEDDDEERKKETKPKPLPKISYTDKMLVSVMGAVFNMLLAFALSCVLYFFGYDVSDAQLTTKVGYVADTVERWNPLVSEGKGYRSWEESWLVSWRRNYSGRRFPGRELHGYSKPHCYG